MQCRPSASRQSLKPRGHVRVDGRAWKPRLGVAWNIARQTLSQVRVDGRAWKPRLGIAWNMAAMTPRQLMVPSVMPYPCTAPAVTCTCR